MEVNEVHTVYHFSLQREHMMQRGLERAKPKPQCQLLLFALILQNVNQKGCAHEYNYVVRLPTQPVKEVYHIIIFMCTAFQFHILQGQRKQL